MRDGIAGQAATPKPKLRYRFAPKAKPRNSRGISRERKSALSGKNSRKTVRNTAAAGQHTGRRVNRLPEWTDPRSYITKGGRHRLFGADMSRLRRAASMRADAYCECKNCAISEEPLLAYPGLRRPHLWAGELAHNEHGSRKSDELHRVKWKNWQCHEREHNCNGKPCPRKQA